MCQEIHSMHLFTKCSHRIADPRSTSQTYKDCGRVDCKHSSAHEHRKSGAHCRCIGTMVKSAAITNRSADICPKCQSEADDFGMALALGPPKYGRKN
ncbi:hypothetical protein SISNIDRAFT_460348 [Sistotremastrum niveocremeum HHB9708]|uniref:FPG-type domain-containing protein n=2 Tax=Sistotremastraceae TaxID=3402574 RepID=A0A164NPF9_9AGAM|nr:hypothetical protein SISNIDRAFT_460348 [Sistotremastrum niveocremeum HHB9708]KZT31829.1 hypothetical protein SISSUDRAFT_1056204 [Sistotremastrum suecicum HHB10207 ss-3]